MPSHSSLPTPAFDYIRCPINRYTFKVKAIRQWVEGQCEGTVLNLFSGMTKLAVKEVRNDLDENAPADYHQDALLFLEQWKGPPFDTILLDPPFSLRKSMELYEGRTVSQFLKIKEKLPFVLKPGGKVITFGYHSCVMGRKRGFEIERIALFSHGGVTHDTIASVERYTPHINQ